MVGAIERAPREFQSLRLPQKCLCVAEMVGAYLWPLFGIVAALVMWRRGWCGCEHGGLCSRADACPARWVAAGVMRVLSSRA